MRQIEITGVWVISLGMFLISAALILGGFIRSGLNQIAEAIERRERNPNDPTNR